MKIFSGLFFGREKIQDPEQIVLFIVVNGGGDILILEYERGDIMLPGGHVETLENPDETIVREGLEEVGLLIKTAKDAGVVAIQGNRCYHLYICYSERRRIMIEKSSGIKKAFWINPEELLAGDYPKKMSEVGKKALNIFLIQRLINQHV